MTQIFALPLIALKTITSLLFEGHPAEEFIRAERAKALASGQLGR